MLQNGKLVFDVTEADIVGAKRGDLHNCPIARAVKRTVDENREVRVVSDIRIFAPDTEGHHVSKSDAEVCVPLPEVLRKEIRDYDETGKMRTFHAKLTAKKDC